MNSNFDPVSGVPLERFADRPDRRFFCRSLSWAAVLAGLVAALALQVLFMLLGAGLGFAIYSPLTDDSPIASLGAGAIVVQGMSAVLSLWFGGWVAGRFTPLAVRSSACLHGFLVWCSATVAGVLIVSTGAGWMLGDLSKIVGGGLSMAGKPAAAAVGGAADLAKEAAQQSGDAFESFVGEALGGRPDGGDQAAGIRAKREIGLAVARFFNPAQPDNATERRTALVQALVDHSNLSQADADRIVTQWTATYDQMKAEFEALKEQAEAKAREAADEAARALSIFSLGAFIAFVIGAIAASCGGTHGGRCATKCESRREIPDAA